MLFLQNLWQNCIKEFLLSCQDILLSRWLILAITDSDDRHCRRRRVMNSDGLLVAKRNLLMVCGVSIDVFTTMVVVGRRHNLRLLLVLLLPMAIDRWVSPDVARWRTLLDAFLHWTQLLVLLLVLVSMLRLLRHCQVVLVVLCHATLAPILGRVMFNETCVIDFSHGKHGALILAENILH